MSEGVFLVLLESAGFIFFSTIEGIGLFILMLSIFRLKVTDFLWQALFIILLMSLQSFVMRHEFELSYVVPLINLVLFSLLLATVWKVPVLWSVIVSISGYFAFGFIQSLIVLSLFGSLEAPVTIDINIYAAQTITGFITSLLGYILNKFGIGFTFDFEKLRFQREHLIVASSVISFLIIFTIILYKNEVWLNIIFTAIGMMFLLYYAVRKENGCND